jgi:hypothetical protein
MALSTSKKSTDSARASRAAIAASRLNRPLSDEERQLMYRQAMYQSALPDLPPIPGFHVCWLTTTNSRDPLAARFRMGYELCKPEDFGQQFEFETLKTGEYAGCLGVNEMVAAKIKLETYQGYMLASHHEMPAHEESKLADTARQLKRQAEQMGANVQMGDGLTSIPDADDIPEPDFTEFDRSRSETAM